jgi:hypothetical protein
MNLDKGGGGGRRLQLMSASLDCGTRLQATMLVADIGTRYTELALTRIDVVDRRRRTPLSNLLRDPCKREGLNQSGTPLSTTKNSPAPRSDKVTPSGTAMRRREVAETQLWRPGHVPRPRVSSISARAYVISVSLLKKWQSLAASGLGQL